MHAPPELATPEDDPEPEKAGQDVADIARPRHRGRGWRWVGRRDERRVSRFRYVADLVVTLALIPGVMFVCLGVAEARAWSTLGGGVLMTLALCLTRVEGSNCLTTTFAGLTAGIVMGAALIDGLDPTQLSAYQVSALMLAVTLCSVAPGALVSLRRARHEPAGIPRIVLRYATVQSSLAAIAGLTICLAPLLYAADSAAHLGIALLMSAGVVLGLSALFFEIFVRTDMVAISALLVRLDEDKVIITRTRFGYRFTVGRTTVKRPWFGGDSVGFDSVRALTGELGLPTPSIFALRQLASDVVLSPAPYERRETNGHASA